MAGYPRAARAVGNAMAANPIPVVVPCHRVIRVGRHHGQLRQRSQLERAAAGPRRVASRRSGRAQPRELSMADRLAQLHMTVITGMSGAGKSEAVATFEDMGYFCIDNLPPQMLPRVVELFALEGSRVDRVALVFDVRAGSYFEQLGQALGSSAGDRASPSGCSSWRRPTRRWSPATSPPGGRIRCRGRACTRASRRSGGCSRRCAQQADVVIDTTGLVAPRTAPPAGGDPHGRRS